MSLVAAVESGRGVTIAPAFLAAIAGRRFRCVPLEPPPAPAVVGVAYRPDSLKAITRQFLEAARCTSAQGQCDKG
jgi:DNA-binding transcriptional LysR family regulator